MLTIETVVHLRQQLDNWRELGNTIALVPTMGNLHAGHLSLVDRAQQLADRVVVSIFVNPTQFVAGEDFDNYPRTLADDQALLEGKAVDILFYPPMSEIYPDSSQKQTQVRIPHLEGIFCGAHRPGHFQGVATVVTKLLNIVDPDFAVFGQKDYQQLLVIQCLVRDLCFPVEIVAMPTSRDEDGLAMSSRNRYLSANERQVATTLYKVLKEISESIISGKCNFKELELSGIVRLEAAGLSTDYLAIVDANTLGRPENKDLVVMAAVRVGQARLIDNILIRR